MILARMDRGKERVLMTMTAVFEFVAVGIDSPGIESVLLMSAAGEEQMQWHMRHLQEAELL